MWCNDGLIEIMFSWRERQLKLEKVRATQQHIEEFKRQQAEWRRMEQEKMEGENKRIMEFASQQEQLEETRMAKIREREEAKEHLHKLVEITFYLYSFNDTRLHSTPKVIHLCSPLAVWEDGRGEAAAWRDGASPWGTLFRRTRRG